MVPERGVRKQQNTSRTLADLSALADAVNAAMVQCNLDAAPAAVHQLRTGSRRVQAMLQATLREAGPVAEVLQQPARAWLRELKKVRQAAGAVRDLDVHRALLATCRATQGRPAPLAAQTEALDAWLALERQQEARRMQKRMKKRRQRVMERQCMVFVALSSLPSALLWTSRSTDAAALREFVRVSDAMPSLDADNLHDFRKAIKKARYVAEAGAQDQPYSQVAKALKRVQDAIGEWHDWHCLANASSELKAGAPELTEFLRQAAERHLTAAIKTTESMRGKLLGEWMATQQAGPRRSPASVVSRRPRKRA
jgi:CHAD domain-containing protein